MHAPSPACTPIGACVAAEMGPELGDPDVGEPAGLGQSTQLQGQDAEAQDDGGAYGPHSPRDSP